jgi:hypothetical protein
MSPTGWISPKKYQRGRVLRNMRIDEISSVDRGAGHGVRVMLTKRDGDATRPWDGVGKLGDRGFRYVQKEDSSMREHNLVSVAKGLGNAVAKGLDGESFAKLQTQLAVEMYPDAPTPGHALAKLMSSNVGKDMIAKAARTHYERLQLSSRCGDADLVQKLGPEVHHAQHATSDPDGVEEPYDKKHARLVAAGFSADESHTMLHRLEKQRRGIG